MTGERKEDWTGMGHRRAGRLMRQNGISVVRTRKRKLLGHPKDALLPDVAGCAKGASRCSTHRC